MAKMHKAHVTEVKFGRCVPCHGTSAWPKCTRHMGPRLSLGEGCHAMAKMHKAHVTEVKFGRWVPYHGHVGMAEMHQAHGTEVKFGLGVPCDGPVVWPQGAPKHTLSNNLEIRSCEFRFFYS